MAKRKAARATSRKAASTRGGARGSKTSKAGARKRQARTAAKKTARKAARKAPARKTAARTSGSRKAPARKTAVRKAPARKTAARKATSRNAPVRTTPARKAPPVRKAVAPNTLPARKAPALNRARRTIQDDDLVPTPPSSLDLDRSASSVRSGRRELRDRYNQHTETSPALTGGDVDADWESAYSVGDEAPGGDNPTPDQDIVDDIGRAVGIEYQDNEELKGEKKLLERDKHRWELDPASSEDYDDRD